MRPVTLQSIADYVGLSKYAVSRALAGKSGVSDETRQLILRAAGELGYVATPAAQVHRKAKTPTRKVKVVFRDPALANRELWIDIQNGVEMEAARCGLPIETHWADNAERIRQISPETLGFIFLGPNEMAALEAARKADVPSVYVNQVVPPLYGMDQIEAGDEETGVYVGHFLAGLGHRQVAYVHGQRGFPGRELRFRGFREAIATVDGARLEEITFPEDYSAAGLGEILVRMSHAGSDPTAFFCGSDVVAVTVMSEITRLGLRVPDDVSIVGQGGFPVATQVSPNLTTISVPRRQMGIAAVRMLKARLGIGEPINSMPFQRLSFVPTFVEGQSAGPMKPICWREVLKGGNRPGASANSRDRVRR